MSYLQHILIHHPTVFYAVCSVFCKMQESGSGLLHLLQVTLLCTSTIKWCNTYEKHCWIICSTSPNQTVVSVQQFNHECFKKNSYNFFGQTCLEFWHYICPLILPLVVCILLFHLCFLLVFIQIVFHGILQPYIWTFPRI